MSEATSPEEARARLFGFTGGGEEEDQPTFAAALDAYAAVVRAETLADGADVDEFLTQLHDTPYTRQTDWVTENYTLIRKAR